MQCPECGFTLTPLDKECPRCVWLSKQPAWKVRATPAPPPMPIEQTQSIPTPLPMDTPLETSPQYSPLPVSASLGLICPVCSASDVQKVSAFVHGGTIVTTSSSVALGGGNVVGGVLGVSSSTSVGQSELVRMLAAPQEPKLARYNTSGCLIGLLTLFGAPFLLVGLASMAATPAVAGISLLIGLGMCGGAFAMWRSGEKDLQERTRQYHLLFHQWLEVMQQWEMLFYCGRCGCVFHIQTRQASPPQEMYRLLGP